MNLNAYLERAELADFVAIAVEGGASLVRRGWTEYAEILAGGGSNGGAEWVGGGRAAHPLVTLTDGRRVLVRAYRRGGFIRHFNRARYFGGHRAFDELLATERARLGGVRVPVIVAATERRHTVGYTATLASCWIDEAEDSFQWLSSKGADRSDLLTRIGEQIALMHRSGVAHPDVNLRNLLITRGGQEVTILDFDRALLYQGEVPHVARLRDILRLGRSARKLGVDMGLQDWKALAAGYGAGWPLAHLLG